MSQFNNNYYLMRHGQSVANVKGLIISDPAVGCTGYGLTELGRQQVLDAAQLIQDHKPTRVISSDFLRTQQTAELITSHFEIDKPTLEADLRERYFGELDGGSDEHYKEIWEQDLLRVAVYRNAESVDAVLQRGLKALKKIETDYHNQTILLVSHGDFLQILQTAFAAIQPYSHRDLVHHQQAEIKLLAAVGDTTPFS